MSRAQELRQLNADALRAKAEELRVQIATLKFGGSEREKNVKHLRTLRHERARILTLLRERELTKP